MEKALCNIMNCPFSHRACTECGIYRGRHRYMAFRSHAGDGKGDSENAIAAYFKSMEKLSNPWDDQSTPLKERLTIRLTLIDAESGKARSCGIDEAKTWDWKDPETMRIINDRIVTSFEHLVRILRYKEGQGHQEVELYEFPRFMFLAGG